MENFWLELHQFDQELTLMINSLHTGFTDEIMKIFSHIKFWIPMYILVVIFLFIRLGWKKALIIVATTALAFGMCDQFSNLIKDAVARLRPCRDDFMIQNGLRMLEGGGGRFGFFSAHAANSFSFAISTFMGFRNDTRLKYRGYGIWIFFWAFMVSISRIFVGKHYLGDVLAGIIIGSAIGFLAVFIARFTMKKLKLDNRADSM